MAEANNYPRSVFGTNSSNDINIENPSRLTRSTKDLRNSLVSRNLYTNFKEYPNDPNSIQKIVNSVSSVIDVIAPFKSVDLNNSVFARLVTEPNSPLSDIGLAVLGQQFAYNFKSNLAQETFPSINISNLFDGDPNTKLFTENLESRITIRESATTLDNFLQRFVGFYPQKYYPFNPNSTNDDYLNNTGEVQLKQLYKNFNQNIYKPSDQIYDTLNPDLSLDKRSDIINGKSNRSSNNSMIFYTFDDQKFNPYGYDSSFYSYQNIELVNISMRRSYTEAANETQEYAPNREYIENYLGNTEGSFRNQDQFNSETGFNEDINNQIIWGRDGINDGANTRIESLKLRGETPNEENISSNDNLRSKNNVRIGLLEYTRNLLNASEGKFVDQTRKRFQEDSGRFGYNGSGLWSKNNSSYASDLPNNGNRQHTILDQYDRFAKSIRFDGNSVYGGNENSVIYDSVLPRIHPTPVEDDNNKVNNKNLMFSIENLAVKVFENESYGIIDDEYGTQIPLSEIGQNGGRMLWFPPYGIELNEVSNAKYDSNVFIGRSEPIYTYQHSERQATLSFLMIMDYPPQVRNLVNGDHEALSQFFAFGGDQYLSSEEIDNISEKIEENIKLIDEIRNNKPNEVPEIPKRLEFNLSFPNDKPKIGNINTIIDEMYLNDEYEIFDGLTPNSFGINENVYNLEGLDTTDPLNPTFTPPSNFSQYNYKGIVSDLDRALFDYFNNPDNVKYTKIQLIGKASKLYTPNDTTDIQEQKEYNLALSERRAEAVQYFIKQRVKNIEGLGQKIAEAINFEIIALGDDGALEENATVSAITEQDTKYERSVNIIFSPTSNTPDQVEPTLTPDEERVINILLEENVDLNNKINQYKRGSVRSNYVMKERTKDDEAILKGFKALTGNYFQPSFHSQTPEDFHRRLTFLQQCTRQGSAIRTDSTTDDNGIQRARNSVFGRQPICILRIGDFFNTKVVIESVNFDYSDASWDTNPEGFGCQYMRAEITLQMKVIGGQSLKGPIDALQNAASFNYYANSTFSNKGIYAVPSYEEAFQYSGKEGIDTNLSKKINELKSTRDKAIKELLENSKKNSE